MDYISTRGFGPVSFDQMMLHPVAPDGGLYMPVRYPKLSMEMLESFAYQSYEEIAERVLSQFLPGGVHLRRAIEKAAAGFADNDVAPILQYDDRIWLQEMYYGPTLSDKDISLQLMAELMPLRDKTQTIIMATQGDSGAAAVEAFANHEGFNVVVVFPKGRISQVSQQQICTSGAYNVYPVALDADFDTCQHHVREILQDVRLVQQLNMTSAGSFSWLRALISSVPFFVGWSRLGQMTHTSFSIPSGNFTTAFAGYLAMQCGLPVEKLIVASARTGAVHQWLSKGAVMPVPPAVPSHTPHLDLNIPVNLERLLCDALGRDSKKVRHAMELWRRTGHLPQIDPLTLHELQSVFQPEVISDIEMMCALSEADAAYEIVLDPHSALALAAAKKHTGTIVSVCPTSSVKFPHSVKNATSKEMLVEEEIEELLAKTPQFEELEADALHKFIVDTFVPEV